MAIYKKTPGVYIEEISTLPPSVAEVATAVPAFIGYTETGPEDTAAPIIKRVATMLEFETFFGKARAATFNITESADPEGVPAVERVSSATEFSLYYALSLYFSNGGGPCYVVAVGNYTASPGRNRFSEGLAALGKEDEPTLIVLTDAACLLPAADYYQLCSEALKQCERLGDRFTIIDVVDDPSSFKRDSSLSANLKYGAAYYPYLNSSISYAYEKKDVMVGSPRSVPVSEKGTDVLGDGHSVEISFTGPAASDPHYEVTLGQEWDDLHFSITNSTLSIHGASGKTGHDVAVSWIMWKQFNSQRGFDIVSLGGGTNVIASADVPSKPIELEPLWTFNLGGENGVNISFVGIDQPSLVVTLGATTDNVSFEISGEALTIGGANSKTGKDIDVAWRKYLRSQHNSMKFNVVKCGDGSATVATTELSSTPFPRPGSTTTATLESIKSSKTAVYNKAEAVLAEQRVILPPSAAIAGIYARVDREQGVWKAPANVGVLGVFGPVKKITDADQEELNVDVNDGKSINAIRAFTGKGTLVWGARTLAGNSNEWRYVSVRRLFITIEESTKKASAFAVFEPNDQSTWLKVKAMIESYLYGMWQQGALAGSKPEDAYYVCVGLGTTMKPQDVLEGRMIVKIGVAAVRPAEFIILGFSHKMQTA